MAKWTPEQRKAASDAAKARLAANNAVEAGEAEDILAFPSLAEMQGTEPIKIMQKAGIVEEDNDPIIRDDESNVSFMATAMDPWMGAIIEDGWRYVKVAEHKAGMNLPSNKQKFLRLGYTIAPARQSVRKVWEESQHWVMRLPQVTYDARAKAAKDAAQENAQAQQISPEMEVLQHQQKKLSLNDMGVSLNG